MSALIVTIIALATLAVGAVYPWAYLPLFAAAALIGLAGLLRRGVRSEMRPLALSLLLVWTAGAIQLLPLPLPIVAWLSPATADLLQTYSLTFPVAERVPLSIEPSNTQIAVLAVGVLGLYLLGLSSLLTSRHLRSVPRALAMFAVPFALFSIYSREYQNGLIYWFWRPLEGPGGNLFGPFVNRNHYGGWMLMTLCLLVGWLFGQIERTLPERHARRSRTVTWLSSAEANGVVLMSFAVLVGVISLFWTLSRSSIMGFAAAAVVFTGLVLTRRRLGAARRTVGVGVLTVVFLAGVAWRGPLRLLDWFQNNNLVSRLDAWRDGWDVILAFPLFGTGLNTYPVAMLFYQTRNPGFYMSQAHNDYMQLLAEGGALVAIPALIAIAALTLAIRRNLRLARVEARGYWIRAGATVGLLAIAVQEVVEFSLQIPANALLFCTLAAIALAPVSARPSPSRELRDNTGAPTAPADVAVQPGT